MQCSCKGQVTRDQDAMTTERLQNACTQARPFLPRTGLAPSLGSLEISGVSAPLASLLPNCTLEPQSVWESSSHRELTMSESGGLGTPLEESDKALHMMPQHEHARGLTVRVALRLTPSGAQTQQLPLRFDASPEKP